jgi:hypothetical protein
MPVEDAAGVGQKALLGLILCLAVSACPSRANCRASHDTFGDIITPDMPVASKADLMLGYS